MSDEYSSGAAPTASLLVQRLTIILAVLLVIGSLFWAGDVYRKGFGWLLFPQQIVSGLIGISTALVFLHIPAGGGERIKVPWYDIVAAIAGLIVGFYVAVNYEQMSLDVPFQKLDGIICGIDDQTRIFSVYSCQLYFRKIKGERNHAELHCLDNY